MENAAVEKEYIGDEELELGLGLSLGNASGEKGGAYGGSGRILTAKDFPNGFACGTKRERAQKSAASSDSAAVSRQVVGWPPIRSYRMNSLLNQAKASNVAGEDDESSKKKMNHGGHLGFVKVNMDGLPIGRKLDLNAHKTYQTLAKTLEEMFFSPSPHSRGGKEHTVKLLDGSSEFVLTYEDKEGDWMLVGDVPWGMFLNTVKRLRIMRTSEANGLAPKSQERNEKQKSKLI
ncbi:auxin-responsive protein IAA13-like isoform X1 [Salvia hispanica]|uniref:auxin-responsive protein IAA13-like isoform X1 n=1 Tax=Salvia hispanica TaxID=49212 RepID=UPI002009616B|nr:auxin-responsive protein IAA13-like isoform X1 [Salvia hispanica]